MPTSFYMHVKMVSIVHYIHQDRLHLIICLIFILIMKIMELKYPLFCCWIVYSFDSFWIQFLSFLVLFFSSTFLRLFHWIVLLHKNDQRRAGRDNYFFLNSNIDLSYANSRSFLKELKLRLKSPARTGIFYWNWKHLNIII